MKSLLILATALLAGSAFAAGPKAGPKIGPGSRPLPMGGPSDPIVRLIQNPKVAEELGLTDEQKAKIAEINKASHDPELQKNLRESMKKQAELLKAETIDEAAVMAEIDKAYDLRKEAAKRQTKRIIAIKSTLTPEQVKKALEIMKARRAKPPKAMGKKDKAPGETEKKPDAPKEDGDKPDAPPPPPPQD